MLPSFNQIGFDSLHYLGGAVCSLNNKIVFWFIGGKRLSDDTIVPNPKTDVRFPLLLEYRKGLVTLTNYEGFSIRFVGSWEMPIASYRIATNYDSEARHFDSVPTYNVTANCDEIKFYGKGLKLMGISELNGGRMFISGSLELKEKEPAAPLEKIGKISICIENSQLVANVSDSGLKMDEHVFGLLVSSGEKIMRLPYAFGTRVEGDGFIKSVSLDLGKNNPLLKGKDYTVYFMVDTYPANSLLLQY
jgi:hypothetical protein